MGHNLESGDRDKSTATLNERGQKASLLDRQLAVARHKTLFNSSKPQESVRGLLS